MKWIASGLRRIAPAFTWRSTRPVRLTDMLARVYRVCGKGQGVWWSTTFFGVVGILAVSLVSLDKEGKSALDNSASTAAFMVELPLAHKSQGALQTAVERLAHLQPLTHIEVSDRGNIPLIEWHQAGSSPWQETLSSWVGLITPTSGEHAVVHDGKRLGTVVVMLQTSPLAWRFLRSVIWGVGIWACGAIVFAGRRRLKHKSAHATLPATVQSHPPRRQEDMLEGMNTHFSTLLDNMVQLKAQMDSAYTRLFYQATHDALTQVYNRFYFDLFLEHALEQAARKNSMFGIVFIDCNDFKLINDQYGHLSGDSVLHEVAARLRDAFAPHGDVFRYGGDEFAILLDKFESETAFHTLVKKLPTLFDAPVRLPEPDTLISINVARGGALYPSDGRDATALMNVADTRMYKDKIGRRYSSGKVQ